jgi:hypothetical protein
MHDDNGAGLALLQFIDFRLGERRTIQLKLRGAWRSPPFKPIGAAELLGIDRR